jgi:hypothetical protein
MNGTFSWELDIAGSLRKSLRVFMRLPHGFKAVRSKVWVCGAFDGEKKVERRLIPHTKGTRTSSTWPRLFGTRKSPMAHILAFTARRASQIFAQEGITEVFPPQNFQDVWIATRNLLSARRIKRKLSQKPDQLIKGEIMTPERIQKKTLHMLRLLRIRLAE